MTYIYVSGSQKRNKTFLKPSDVSWSHGVRCTVLAIYHVLFGQKVIETFYLKNVRKNENFVREVPYIV